VVVGDAKQEPRLAEVIGLLAKPDVSVVVNLLAIDPPERPRFLVRFLPEMAKLRAETGRPHWIVLDEAHHCLPAKWDPAPSTLTQELPAVIAVTVHPRLSHATSWRWCRRSSASATAPSMLSPSSAWQPDGRLRRPTGAALVAGQVHLLSPSGDIEVITTTRPKERQKRHARKYAEGELGEDRSFYFRGPEKALNLRAHNLRTFLQMAAGVDDRTWLHHLRGGEYSRWFRERHKGRGPGCRSCRGRKRSDLVAQGQSGMHQANDRTAIHSAGATVAGWRTFLALRLPGANGRPDTCRRSYLLNGAAPACVLSKSGAVRRRASWP
jgi:hypothetical protein